jgi:hypothetical protein
MTVDMNKELAPYIPTLHLPDKEEFFGGYRDVVESLGLLYLDNDGGMAQSNFSIEEGEVVWCHLLAVFGVEQFYICAPFAVLFYDLGAFVERR